MTKIGEYELKGSAVEKFGALIDDNHADPADEEGAIANFDKFADSFFASNRSAIGRFEKEDKRIPL
jgi:hypothetical protein